MPNSGAHRVRTRFTRPPKVRVLEIIMASAERREINASHHGDVLLGQSSSMTLNYSELQGLPIYFAMSTELALEYSL